MVLTLALAALSADSRPLNLDALTIDRVRSLDGQVVTVTFIVAKPAYTLLGRTVVGAAERDDGAERSVVRLGRRLDVRDGHRLTVRGRLILVRYRADVVAGVAVPAWDEIRVTEER